MLLFFALVVLRVSCPCLRSLAREERHATWFHILREGGQSVPKRLNKKFGPHKA